MADRINANLPSRDFSTTAEFYGQLGFSVGFRDEGWMILNRGPLELEFFPHPDLDPAESWFSACIRVEDLDALRRVCEAAGVRQSHLGFPRLQDVPDSPDVPHMFALVDPDGSLLRCIDERS
jgi:catechol 2,3-dioxygenase-like lactoylglutathione lyase family enzyme